ADQFTIRQCDTVYLIYIDAQQRISALFEVLNSPKLIPHGRNHGLHQFDNFRVLFIHKAETKSGLEAHFSENRCQTPVKYSHSLYIPPETNLTRNRPHP